MSEPQEGSLARIKSMFRPGTPEDYDVTGKRHNASESAEDPVVVPEVITPVTPEAAAPVSPDASEPTVEEGTDASVVEAGEDAAVAVENPEVVAAVAEEAVVAEIGTNPAAAEAVATAIAPDETPAERAVTVAAVSEPGMMAKIGKSVANHFKENLPAGLGGFLVGAAGRSAIKLGVKALLGGTAVAGGLASFGIAMFAGGVAGGAIEGIRRTLKERTKFVVADALTKFDAAEGDKVKQVAIAHELDRLAKESLLTGDKEQIQEAATRARAFLVPFETALKAGELKGDTEKNKIAFIISKSRSVRKQVPNDERKAVAELLDTLKFDSKTFTLGELRKDKEARSRIIHAAGRGAAVGALGGAAGFAFMEAAEWLRGGAEVVEKVAGAGSGPSGEYANMSAAELEQLTGISGASAEKVGTTLSKESLVQIRNALMEAKYESIANRGEGVTHLARKAIHDFLINSHWSEKLSVEQLVYMEDSLVKDALKHGTKELVQPDQKMSWTGQQIADVLEKARGLNEGQIKNLTALLKTREHSLSKETIAFLNDRSKLANPSNTQWEQILAKFKEVVASTSSATSSELPMAAHVTEGAATSSAETYASQQSSLKIAAQRILGVTAAAAIGGGIYALFNKWRKRRDDVMQEVVIDLSPRGRHRSAPRETDAASSSSEAGTAPEASDATTDVEEDSAESSMEQRQEILDELTKMLEVDGRMGEGHSIVVDADFIENHSGDEFADKIQALMKIAASSPALFRGLKGLRVGEAPLEVSDNGETIILPVDGSVEELSTKWTESLERAKSLRESTATAETKELEKEPPKSFKELAERLEKEGYEKFSVAANGDLGNPAMRRDKEPEFAKAVFETIVDLNDKTLIPKDLNIFVTNQRNSGVWLGGNMIRVTALRGIPAMKRDLARALTSASLVREGARTIGEVNKILAAGRSDTLEAAPDAGTSVAEPAPAESAPEPDAVKEPEPVVVPSSSPIAKSPDTTPDIASNTVEPTAPVAPDIEPSEPDNSPDTEAISDTEREGLAKTVEELQNKYPQAKKITYKKADPKIIGYIDTAFSQIPQEAWVKLTDLKGVSFGGIPKYLNGDLGIPVKEGMSFQEFSESLRDVFSRLGKVELPPLNQARSIDKAVDAEPSPEARIASTLERIKAKFPQLPELKFSSLMEPEILENFESGLENVPTELMTNFGKGDRVELTRGTKQFEKLSRGNVFKVNVYKKIKPDQLASQLRDMLRQAGRK